MDDPSASPGSRRYSIVLPVFFKPKGTLAAKAGKGRTCSLSEGGACLELAEPLAPAMPLSLALQTDQGLFRLEAEVVWVGKPDIASGGILHGVKFVWVTADQQQAVQAILRVKGQAEGRAARVPVRLHGRCRLLEAPGPAWHGWVDDLSREGCALRLPERLTVGAAVEVNFVTPEGDFSAEATVVWVEPPARTPTEKLIRHGLQFTAPHRLPESVLGLGLEEIPTGDEPPRQID